MEKTPQFSIGALGGTFDHFHDGHRHFLKFAASYAQKLLIGVTNKSLTNEKELSTIIEPYEIRTKAVRTFCEEQGILFEIVELTDPFGPTLGQQQVDCLIVTEVTAKGGEFLNKRRNEAGLPSLPIFVSSMLRDESGQILNSTRIRQGKINRTGKVYLKLFHHDILLKESQRQFFKTPLGEIVSKASDEATLIGVVGDRCLAEFLQNAWSYNLALFDLFSQRQQITFREVLALKPDERIKNEAGSIQKEAVQVLMELVYRFEIIGKYNPVHVKVEGEEDLLTAALVMLFPLNSLVYYGQPQVGMVEVKVTEELKERLWQLFLA